eukprot:scaffold31161_cov56-Attheya_sp.AAC.1
MIVMVENIGAQLPLDCVGGGHNSTSFCHILLPPRKGPRRRITTRVTRVKGYRTLQCECCGVRFPSGRGLENHRT